MRAHGNEGRLGRRFLLAAGLTIAVVVPSAAFGGTATFYPKCNPRCAPIGGIYVEREKGKNKRVKALNFDQFRVNCPKSGPQTVMTYLDVPITGNMVRNEIAIDAKVQHRKWHFNELVPDAVGRSSNERIDASINFRGKFRKHNKDKADGTLEVTLEGGATFLDLDMSGTEPIVTERPIVNFEPEDCHGVQDFHVDLLRPEDR
ncbi:MAG TPA: hypothetical protein VIZ61_01935 [Solirubrobacterales bacterium]